MQSGVDSPVDRPLNAFHRWYDEFSFGNWDVEGRRKKQEARRKKDLVI
ncbi:hypothetical protein NDA07_09930 [Microcoleus vaginatus DQ-U2]|nr:hypothetical protein [Microcoleus sp. FACHB-DQ6]